MRTIQHLYQVLLQATHQRCVEGSAGQPSCRVTLLASEWGGKPLGYRPHTMALQGLTGNNGWADSFLRAVRTSLLFTVELCRAEGALCNSRQGRQGTRVCVRALVCARLCARACVCMCVSARYVCKCVCVRSRMRASKFVHAHI